MKIPAAVLDTMGVSRPYVDSGPLVISDLELGSPGPGELLVKIHAAGLCHSDLSVIDGNRPRPVPMVLGHEASGVVEAIGATVTRFSPGDPVVLVFVPSCGQCLPCAAGRSALCELGAAANTQGTLLSGAKRLRRGNEELYHHLGVSAFADYVTVSQHSAIRIDPAFDRTTAALFGCAVLTGVGAVVNTGAVSPGSKGSYIGACVPSRDLPRYMTLYQQGRLPIDRLLSATLKLDDINAGFDALADGTAVRQVMTFG